LSVDKRGVVRGTGSGTQTGAIDGIRLAAKVNHYAAADRCGVEAVIPVPPRVVKAMVLVVSLMTLVAMLLSPVAPPGLAAADPDWPNITYTITCDGLIKNGFSVKLTNGSATVSGRIVGSPDYDHFDVQEQAAAQGAISGVGSASVVLLACSPQPSNFAVQEVQVFRQDGSVVGELPSPSTLQSGAILPPVYVPTGLRLTDGNISAEMLAYGPNDSHASGPSVPQAVTWHWNGSSFEKVF
jgi:hypothetical protein